MKILITNDDCYTAKGLSVLAGILEAYGEITIVALQKAAKRNVHGRIHGA